MRFNLHLTKGCTFANRRKSNNVKEKGKHKEKLDRDKAQVSRGCSSKVGSHLWDDLGQLVCAVLNL